MFQKVCLGLSARDRNPISLTVAVDAAGLDHGQNAIAIFQCLVEKLEDDDTASFRAHIAVSFGIERAAAPVPREHAGLGERDEADRVEVQADASDNGRIALAQSHGVVSLVKRDQRRRTRRVDRQTWSTEVEKIGDTVGRDAAGVAGGSFRVDRGKVIGHAVDVVEARESDEDPAVGAFEFGGFQTGVLQRFPGHFHEKPLLRVHLGCLARGDPEKSRIEVQSVADRPRGKGVGRTGFRLARVEELVFGPAPVLGFRDEVFSSHKALPKGIPRSTGEPKGHPNNSDFTRFQSRYFSKKRICSSFGVRVGGVS